MNHEVASSNRNIRTIYYQIRIFDIRKELDKKDLLVLKFKNLKGNSFIWVVLKRIYLQIEGNLLKNIAMIHVNSKGISSC